MQRRDGAFVDIANLITLEITVQQIDPLTLPEHSGSMLRGAFGTALRLLTCVTDLSECKLCPLKAHCRFPHIFERPALSTAQVQAVNPYIIHPPIIAKRLAADDIWHFSMSVMGSAIEDCALIVQAWRTALQQGLGARAPYQKARLLQVRCDGVPLYDMRQSSHLLSTPKPSTQLYQNQLLAHENAPLTQLSLQFVTPFRHQQHGKIAAKTQMLDSVTFLASLYNRIQLCQRHHSPDTPWDIGYQDYHAFKADINRLDMVVNLESHHVARRSNRQARKMQLFGLQGQIDLIDHEKTGNLIKLLPALQLGEILHIGKNTTMGLGQYQLKKVAVIK